MAQRLCPPSTAFVLNSRKRPRQKDSAHLDFIRQLSCCICGNKIETEAAHIRMGEMAYGKRPTGLGEKASDCWVLPLCSRHHSLQHTMGEEQFWGTLYRAINPFVLAQSLYIATGDEDTAEAILRLARAKR